MFFYIHTPFCRKKCQYCHFALTPVFDDLKVRVYIDALKREIEEFFTVNPDISIETIYFGGGTPSILTGEQLAEILDIFRKHKIPPTPLSQGGKVEITLESNPEDITSEYLNSLAKLGVNRLSLGVQTLNRKALQTVGRADSNKAIFRALECIKTCPIENISIDLIAGLPHTFAGQMVSDLEQIFSQITPKHVSIYMLEDEHYPVDWKPYLPSEEIIRSEYLAGTQCLQEHGFQRYELSNFAQVSFESRHNQSYWNHSNYRGFGLSAASYIEGERFTNSSSFTLYYQGKKQSEFLNPESLRIERIMFGMRTSGVLLSEFSDVQKVEKLETDELLEIRGNRVFPTSTGIFLIDHIISELI